MILGQWGKGFIKRESSPVLILLGNFGIGNWREGDVTLYGFSEAGKIENRIPVLDRLDLAEVSGENPSPAGEVQSSVTDFRPTR